jgi:cyclophilin family peptidyl-prolyl cis-trans isomerase
MIRALAILACVATTFAAPVPDDVRRDWKLSPWYRQAVMVEGLPIVASEKTSPFALAEASWIVNRLLGHRPEIIWAMAKNRVRFTVMAHSEMTTDVPEHADLKPKVYWDRRARGLGASLENPCVSCAEENLLSFAGDPYPTESITIHEFAHAIHGTGMIAIDPTFEPRLEEAYKKAIGRGLWKGTYAASNKEEYWAEAVQSWIDDNRENDALHNHVNTRAELREYDPAVAALCAEVLGDGPWRYQRPHKRAAADRAHLVGWDQSTAPTFKWRKAPIPERPQVRIQTELGDVEVELNATAAPLTVANFLHLVDEGLYSDGQFFRTVTATNQADDAIKISVVQAQANPKRAADLPPPIKLERTRDTGLKHTIGTISMAREATADTARDHFFLTLEDSPALDFCGLRNPDGQGFAAFGTLTSGLDTLREIHRQPADGQALKTPVRIQRAIRLN